MRAFLLKWDEKNVVVFFRKNTASELLRIIPKMEEVISTHAWLGYLLLSAIEAIKVLSPNSPIKMIKAIARMEEMLDAFVINLEMGLGIKLLLDSDLEGSSPVNPININASAVIRCK